MHERRLPGVFRAHQESGQKTVVSITGVLGGGIDGCVGINVSIGLWTVLTDDLAVWRFSLLAFVESLLATCFLVFADVRSIAFLLIMPFAFLCFHVGAAEVWDSFLSFRAFGVVPDDPGNLVTLLGRIVDGTSFDHFSFRQRWFRRL